MVSKFSKIRSKFEFHEKNQIALKYIKSNHFFANEEHKH